MGKHAQRNVKPRGWGWGRATERSEQNKNKESAARLNLAACVLLNQ